MEKELKVKNYRYLYKKLNFEKNEIEKELENKEKFTREDINKLTDKRYKIG